MAAGAGEAGSGEGIAEVGMTAAGGLEHTSPGERVKSTEAV